MAGQRRLHGHLGRLLVANLANHDAIRSWRNIRAQAALEREPLRFIHRDLGTPCSSYSTGSSIVRSSRARCWFRRLPHRVSSSCPLRSARDEQHAIGQIDQRAQRGEHIRIEPEDREAQHPSAE